MSFHIPSIEAAQAIAGPEVAAAKKAGTYKLNWDNKACGHTHDTKQHAARLRLLSALSDAPMTTAEIRAATGMSNSGVTFGGRNAEADGHVTRQMIAQRMFITITDAGRAWLAQNEEA